MVSNSVPPTDVTRPQLEDAVRRTTVWAERQLRQERAPGQLLFGIAQGHSDEELRRRSIDEITEQFRIFGEIGYTEILVRHLTNNQSKVLGSLEWLAMVRAAPSA